MCGPPRATDGLHTPGQGLWIMAPGLQDPCSAQTSRTTADGMRRPDDGMNVPVHDTRMQATATSLTRPRHRRRSSLKRQPSSREEPMTDYERSSTTRQTVVQSDVDPYAAPAPVAAPV